MNRLKITSSFLLAASIAIALPATALDLPAGASIYGDYLESRSAEVVVGHCLANAESGLAGREAILAWTVRAGEWKGQSLEGLSVLAVVQSPSTIGDVANEPVEARTVM